MVFPVTSIYAALILLIAVALVFWITGARRSSKVGLGDGGDEELLRRMRSQANLIETAPLLLIAMGMMELNGMPDWFMHIFGIILVIARVVHPIGMTNRYPQYPFRFGGTVATVTLMIVAAIVLLGQVVLGE